MNWLWHLKKLTMLRSLLKDLEKLETVGDVMDYIRDKEISLEHMYDVIENTEISSLKKKK